MMVEEKSIITPGYVHAPEDLKDVPVNDADVRLTDDAPAQIDVLPLDPSSEPLSGTPDTQSSD